MSELAQSNPSGHEPYMSGELLRALWNRLTADVEGELLRRKYEVADERRRATDDPDGKRAAFAEMQTIHPEWNRYVLHHRIPAWRAFTEVYRARVITLADARQAKDGQP